MECAPDHGELAAHVQLYISNANLRNAHLMYQTLQDP